MGAVPVMRVPVGKGTEVLPAGKGAEVPVGNPPVRVSLPIPGKGGVVELLRNSVSDLA